MAVPQTVKLRGRKKTPPASQKNSEAGFILAITAIVMIAAAIFFISMIALGISNLREASEVETEKRMDAVSRALSAYAQRHYRIPCPAEPDESNTDQPFGTERGSGAAGLDYGDCPFAEDQEGILPFRTLGLDPALARDAWGNWMTYAVNPAFTVDPDDDTLTVHAACRVVGRWFEGVVIGGGGGLVQFEEGVNVNISDMKVLIIGGDGSDVEIINNTQAIRLEDNDYVRIGGGIGSSNVRIIGNAQGMRVNGNKRLEIGGNGNIEFIDNNNVRMLDNDELVFGANSNLIIEDNDGQVIMEYIVDNRLADGGATAGGAVFTAGAGTVDISGNTSFAANGFNGGFNAGGGNGAILIRDNQHVRLEGTGEDDDFDEDDVFGGLRNFNPQKARFCCPNLPVLETAFGPAPAVLNAAGTLIWEDDVPLDPDEYGPANRPGGAALGQNIEAMAFVLISHGMNGSGAYISTGARLPTGGLSANELENTNENGVYVIAPRTDLGVAGYYDDLVLWKTQRELFNMTGHGKCTVPN